MRKARTVLTSLGALTASLAVVSAAAVSAGAAGPYVVKTGTHTTGTSSYSAATTGATPQITLKDITSNQTLTCNNGGAGGVINNGMKPTGAKLATIANTAFNGCTGPGGLALNVTQVGTWYVNGTKPTTASGVTNGNITAINAHVAANVASQCSFDAKGTIIGRFANTPQTLTVPGTGPTLTLSGVQGCFGLINNGDKASFKAIYKLTAPDGKISITNG